MNYPGNPGERKNPTSSLMIGLYVIALKYVSFNRLSDFEFHDSVLTLVSVEDQRLILNATHLNVHKGIEQNPHIDDMEIALASLTFEGFVICSYEPGRAWKRDEKGHYYTDEPQIILSGKEANDRFMKQIKSGITVLDLGEKEGSIYFIDGISEDPFFTLCFVFQNVSIEWDDFKGKAWYNQ